MGRQVVRQRRPWVFEGGYAAGKGVFRYSGSGAPVNGTSGTGNGEGGPGSTYYDSTNGIVYVNVGTAVSPTWSPLTPVSFSLTSANILGMNGASVNLIAAPPAGFAVIVDNILFTMTRTATQYANGGVVSFIYTGSVASHSGGILAAVVTGGAGTVLTQLGPATGANGTTVPTATGVDATNATAPFITGTGTAKVVIDYRVVAQ